MKKILNIEITTLLLIIFQVLIYAFVSQVFASGEIKGVVLDKKSKEPLPGANIIVVGTQMGAASGPDGRFVIPRLPVGIYSVEASMIGYERNRIDNVTIDSHGAVEVNFELTVEAIPLSAVIVTPGHFSLMKKEVTASQTLKREDIRSFPQLGEDVYRAITRLPGLAGNDFSSKFTIRGGEHEEVLVMFDGLELYDPFHLKDFGGVVSVIDVEAIGGIDMVTGAFPAEYGDRMSGVFNIKSATPSYGVRRTSVGLSFMNARFLSEGNFEDGKGQWLVLARRGYLDLVLAMVGEGDNLAPKYYDVLGKVQYQLHKNHAVAAHYLLANDNLELLDNEEGDEVATSYGNMYGWFTWNASFHPNLFAQTVLSYGHVDQDRKGTDFDYQGAVDAKASDIRDFNFFGLKQDWDLTLSNKYLLKWGFDVKRVTADYDYFNLDRDFHLSDAGVLLERTDTTQVNLNPTGTELGVFLSNRLRLLDPITAEVGLRYDYSSWTGDKKISPRLNLAIAFGPQTSFRLGWGRFYQSQAIHKLDVQDNDNIFYPAELAEHRVVGLEHKFQNGINLRVEAYQKKLSNIRPHYRNLANDIDAFPEVENDRVRLDPERGEAKGFEILLKKDSGGKFNWWASYGYAFAEDKIDGVTVPRNFDQRHTLYLDSNYRPNKKWHINLSWQYHSGWPYTKSTFEKIVAPDGSVYFTEVYGNVNAARFPAYHRLDFRITRFFNLPKGRLLTFLEFRNLYNRKNVRRYYNNLYVYENGNYRVVRNQEEWLPLLPALGISWEF